jgi:hypothetical protein
LVPRVKELDLKDYHSPSSRATGKKMWRFTSIPENIFMALGLRDRSFI